MPKLVQNLPNTKNVYFEIAKDFLKNSNVVKFRQIWSLWLRLSVCFWMIRKTYFVCSSPAQVTKQVIVLKQTFAFTNTYLLLHAIILKYLFLNCAFPDLFFFIFVSSDIVYIKWDLPLTGFDMRISGVGSNRFTNCVTTTDQNIYFFNIFLSLIFI